MLMDRIALALLIVGGVNWGSVGLFRFDIVAWLFGGQTATVSRVVYTLDAGGGAIPRRTIPGESADQQAAPGGRREHSLHIL